MTAQSAQTAVQTIAERLFEARRTAVAIPPIHDELAPLDISSAYAIQRLNTERRIKAGARAVGRKIGLTSQAVQKQLGVDQPDFGMLFDDMAHRGDSVVVKRAGLISPRIEAELAFVLSADIATKVMANADLHRVIASVAASAEIVDSAIADWKIGIVDTIADNASSGAFAIGTPQVYTPDMDLPGRTMRLLKDGELKSSGTGAATLGDPLTALAWLANTAIAFGDPLRKGDIVLSGALGPMIPMDAARYEIEISGFPKLTVQAV